jgi:hypothetical protein
MGSGIASADPGSDQPARLTFGNQSTDGSSVRVKNAFLPAGGYLSIHDARTRLFSDGNVFDRVLESLIGISDLRDPGRHKNVTVPLFNAEAPAVDQYGRSGPLEESQPLIAIPHVNNTGDGFDLTKAGEGGLRGDGAYDGDRGIAKLGGLNATNALATVTLENADRAEIRSARRETADVRREFSGQGR